MTFFRSPYPLVSTPSLPAGYRTPIAAEGSTAAYTSTGLDYASSIDAAILSLTAGCVYDNGCAAAAVTAGTKLPILLMLHGYNGTSSSIGDDPRLRGARNGFVVVTPNMRGRGADDGTEDDSARELQDIVDAIADAVATYPTICDGLVVDVIGYSGGAANAIALCTKYPGRFRHVVALFGFADYGVSPSASHSYWGTGDSSATVVTRIGPRSAMGPYRARLALMNVADALLQSTTRLWLLWDEDDPIGVLLQDVVDVLTAADVPTSRWASDETSASTSYRFEHGYFADHADLMYAENILYNLRTAGAPEADPIGEYIVTGHCVHASGWELWTDTTGSANAKTSATGGQAHVVRVRYNAISGQHYVSPMSGACAVTMIQGGVTVTIDLSSAETVFDLANGFSWSDLIASFDADANTYAAWDADLGVTTVNGAATIWEDQIGALDMGAPLSDPTHDSNDGGHGSVAYAGGTTNTVAVTVAGSYGLALRFRRSDANSGCPICLSDNAESATGRNGLYVVNGSASLQVNPNSGGDVAATDTFTVGTGWHSAFITFDGSTYRLRMNNRTPVTVGTPGAITATRLTLGRLQQAASTFFDFDGSISHVAAVIGRVWTTDEEDEMVAHLGAL